MAEVISDTQSTNSSGVSLLMPSSGYEFIPASDHLLIRETNGSLLNETYIPCLDPDASQLVNSCHLVIQNVPPLVSFS